MAAILQFRQGSKSSFISSGPYISEPFFDTDTNIIHIGVSGSSSITLTKLEDINSGSFSVSGDISGSNLYLSGDITASNTLLSGDITIGGNIILGDQIQDNITVSGQFDSDLIPSASATYDLGSTTKKWNHLYAVSASIDSVDLVTNLPSGVVSSSAQIASYGFDNYGAWAIRGDNNVSVYIGSSTTLNFTGGKGIVTETVSSPTALITLDTGSNHFITAVEDISFTALPAGTVSGSQQVIDLLPSGVVSGSSQLPSGLISGSTQTVDHIESSTLIAINNTSPNNLGYAQLNINDNGTAGTSGLLVFEDGGSLKSFDYVASNIRYIDTNTGVSIAIKPDADGTKSWVFDTDGDLVSNGGNWASGNVYANNLIASSSVTASNMLVDNDIIANNFIGNIQSTNGVISGSSQIINILDSLNSFSSSQESKNTTLATYTGSVDTSIDSLNSFTNSFDTAISLNSSDVTILGNLTVQGTQTQLNTSTLNVEDKNLLIASGAADSSAANGAGITIDGANKSLQWEHGTSQFVFDAQVSSSVGFKGDGSNLTGLTADSVEYDNILNKPTLVSGSDQILGGTNIVSSSQQVITYLPQGTVSGSVQVLGGTNIVSSSQQVINYLPSGTVSGSTQVLGGTNIISSSQQVINYLPSGTVSSSVQIIEVIDSSIPGVVSGSDQVTASLDTRYATLGGNDLLSSSNETFEEYSSSVDTRLLDTLSSGSATSQSLYTLIGHFPTSGALGTAAFYNVSSSLSDDPSTIPNVKAVYDYINNVVQAADITGVSASLGLFGGGDAGYVSLSLDTGSAHFQAGVELYSSTLPSGVVSSSAQITSFGFISGSTTFYNDINNLSVGTNSPTNLGGTQLTIDDNNTAGLSGILSFEDSGTTKSFDYVNSNVRYIDSSGGVSIALKPDGNAAKSWVIDTDGDLVSNGGSWASGNAYMNNLIASSSVTASYILVDNDITANNFIGTILADNGVISGSSQVISSLPSGIISGSAISTDGTDLVAIGTSVGNVADLGSGNQLSLYNSGLSGILSFDDSGTVKSYDYVSSNIRYVDTNSGVSIAIKPDATATKAWVFDTDGDLVSNGGSWNSGNLYSSNVIARNSVTSSYMLVDFDITADTFIGTIAADNGVISGSSQLTSSLDTRYTSIAGEQTYTGNKTFSNNVTISGNLTVSGTTTYTSTNNVNIGDNILELNYGGSATTGGIYVKDATGGNTVSGSLLWNATNDYWTAGPKGSESKVLLAGGDGVISGSSQVNANNIANFDSNVLAYIKSIGVVSGSSQISLGGDLSGTANSATVAKVNGVSITNAEATQLGNIGTVTISSTQWGYLGALDQELTTTSDADFQSVDIRKDNISSGPELSLKNTHNQSDWGTDSHIGKITFASLDTNAARTVASIEVAQEDNLSTYPDETYMVFKTMAGADVNAQEKMRLSADGNLSVNGDVVAYSSSDRRLKDEIQPIFNPIEKINQIGGYSFVWNNEKQNIYNGKDYGVIAQEIEEILPELVQTRENGYKAVKYDKLVSLLIEGIKELSKEVEDLKKKIN